jgi:hypothetical protein
MSTRANGAATGTSDVTAHSQLSDFRQCQARKIPHLPKPKKAQRFLPTVAALPPTPSA